METRREQVCREDVGKIQGIPQVCNGIERYTGAFWESVQACKGFCTGLERFVMQIVRYTYECVLYVCVYIHVFIEAVGMYRRVCRCVYVYGGLQQVCICVQGQKQP